MTDFAVARTRMVDNQLRTSGVTDHRVLAAMGEVARERFVPEGREPIAYADVAHSLGAGRSLGAPAPFARLVQLAEIDHGDSVLDVGAGTGYGTAVIARLASQVTALEPDPELAQRARAALGDVENARVVEAGLDGADLGAEFDVILVEGAVAREPEHLFPLLADGGRLVALIGNGGAAAAHVFVRSGDEVAGRSEFNTTLPPLVAAAPPVTFEF